MTVSKFHDLLQHFQPDPRFPDARDVLDRMAKAPKFVFSDDVLHFMNLHKDEYSDAIELAAKVGQTSLPHDPMVVEYDNVDAPWSRSFWLIEQHERGYRTWLAQRSSGNRVIVFDGSFSAFFTRNGKIASGAYSKEKLLPVLTELERHHAWTPLYFAMTLNIRGIVTRPPPPAVPKLDKARAKKGLPPVTRDYITVHIGFVTDKQGNKVAYREGVGGHVRVHLRRGHIRNQACGPGLRDHKEIWIPWTLVNYVPGVTVEEPNYLVVP